MDHQKQEKYGKILHDIRCIRNKIVHEAKPLQPNEIIKIWSNSQLNDFNKLNATDYKTMIYEGMEITMSWIYKQREETLFQSLYKWGLETLERE